MNNHAHDPAEEAILKQVDAALDHGKRTEMPVINALADSTPQADAAFEYELEKRLIAQLHRQNAQSKETHLMQATFRPSRALSASIWLSAAAVLAIMIAAGFMLMRQPTAQIPAFASQVAVEPIPQQIVVATQNIRAGETITDEMVALVSLPMDDFSTLQDSQPQRQFFHDLADVVGQTTTTAIFWFEPVEPIKLGQVETCIPGSRYCLDVPEGYYTISFPLPFVGLADQGLVAGDRVDVLGVADGQLSVIVRDVLLAEVAEGGVTFAAPSWKHSVLVWLWGTDQPYSLRLADPPTPTAELVEDDRVEYSFTAPEALPDGYRFDLIAEFLVDQSYLLSDAPNLDLVMFTQRDTIMNFWFTDLDVVSITDGTEVVIRLPEANASALDFLLAQGADLSFIPQSE